MLQLRNGYGYDDRWAKKDFKSELDIERASLEEQPSRPGHEAGPRETYFPFLRNNTPHKDEEARIGRAGGDAESFLDTTRESPSDETPPTGPEAEGTRGEHTQKLEGEGVGSDPLKYLAPHHHRDSEKFLECPGGPFTAAADEGSCVHGGAEIHVDFDDEDIEEFFGDNVLMKEWKYYKEGCHQPAQCEFIDPDVNHHQFPVGRSVVRVEGIDIAGNINHCHRSVYIVDKQAPKFVVPPKEVDTSIEIDFPENTCSINAEKPFLEYEEVNGFIGKATDNCDERVTIVKKLQNSQGEIVYDSSADADVPELKGPNQTYTLIYEAIDDYSAGLFDSRAPEAVKNFVVEKTIHTALLTLKDVQPPYDFEGCPVDFVVEIDAHETRHSGVFWVPPTITGDNCDEFGVLPEAEEQTKPLPMYSGMPLEVGAHPVQYAFKDASGNYIPDRECTFTITVEQKAHPVILSCPSNVTVETIEHADFGLPTWEEPQAMQGGKILGSRHISYVQGVEPNLPFPFGTTVVMVRASGEITGTRNDEHLMFDECTFTVTVTDPQIPKVDGRMYRCKESNRDHGVLWGKTLAKPYEVCGGLALDWMPHRAYVDTHYYDVNFVVTRQYECCRSEERVNHVCSPVPGSQKSSYCVPEDSVTTF
jgi:hypothetical protein